MGIDASFLRAPVRLSGIRINQDLDMHDTNEPLILHTIKGRYIDPSALLPIADFSGDPVSGIAPLEVTFIDLTSNNPTAWTWYFGDGEVSHEQNPVHTYMAAGVYNVTLMASNVIGWNTKIKTGYITVESPPTEPCSAGWFQKCHDARNTSRTPTLDGLVLVPNIAYPCVLYAFNEADGTTAWTQTFVGAQVQSNRVMVAPSGDIFLCKYYPGTLYRIDPTDGSILDSVATPAQIRNSTPVRDTLNRIFLSCDYHLMAYDENLDELWDYDIDVNYFNEGSPAVSTPWGEVFHMNITLDPAPATPLIRCLDAATGDVKWEQAVAHRGNLSGSVSLDSSCNLYFAPCGAPDGNYLYSYTRLGGLRWATDVGDAIGRYLTPGIDEARRRVYVVTTGDLHGLMMLVCLDADNGEIKWTFDLTAYAAAGPIRGVSHMSPLIDSSGNIYVGEYTGTLYKINPGGGMEWYIPTIAGYTGGIAINAAETRIYTCYGNFTKALLASDGSTVWTSANMGTGSTAGPSFSE
jgi:PKD repeat protein